MESRELNVVTGAFGYTGKYITRRLLYMGKQVKTLTGHPRRHSPFGDRVAVARFSFDDPKALVESLRGATTLYNTYWIRFPRGQTTYGKAIHNTKTLLKAAEDAGVRRIVHISITNASPDSLFPYFQGKGALEKAIHRSSLTYAIVRPTVIFGPEDILINNIAWLLRRFPIFAIPGSGNYRLQPVFAEDVAELAVAAGQREDNVTVDATGPETFTFNRLVRTIAHAVHSRSVLIHVNPKLALLVASALSSALGDVVIARDELDGLMCSLLASANPPTGMTAFSAWLRENRRWIGSHYMSELKRHYR